MENQDLRRWLARMEAAGELQHVSGAERMEEIGGIVDIYQRKMGRQALLFDDVPGYPRGYRVLEVLEVSGARLHTPLSDARIAVVCELPQSVWSSPFRGLRLFSADGLVLTAVLALLRRCAASFGKQRLLSHAST